MLADLQRDLRVDSGEPLVFHQQIHVADNRWYWYQRYHHLLVDGFSFPAITRANRQDLLHMAAWRTNACFAVYAFR